jgi:HAD superfamily hydrolase (TIGR01509 family)
MRPKAVILDVDGTLVDSNDAHAQAWVEALAEHGHRVPFAKVRPLIGMGGDKLLPRVVGIEEDSPDGKAISTRRGEIFKQRYLPTLRPFPGARALLQRMRADGMKLVVASSAKGDELDPLLEIAGAADLVEHTTSSDDAERSKPDPDIVQAALGKTGCGAHEVLMLGDTPYDLEAAHRAQVGFVGVRSGGWDDDALRGALAVYADTADLLAKYDSSPFSGR